MKKISLSNGGFALVDDEDYELVSKRTWRKNRYGYAVADGKKNGKKIHYTMHRVILQPPSGFDVDHRNGDGLDNRRENIRICNKTQNAQNKPIRKDNKHGYKGVTFIPKTGRWQARITLFKKRISLGRYSTPEEAHRIYVQKAIELFGDFFRK